MIGCRECLSAASTADLGDMQPPSAIGLHCATCPDCARVITEVRDRETQIASALGQLRMTGYPAMLAEQAVASSRRLTARFWRGGLFAAFVTTAMVGIANGLIPAYEREVQIALGGDMVTETIKLSCITPQQASDLATPLLRSGKPALYTARDISAVTVRGVRREFAAAKAAIKEFDAKCQLPPATTVDPHLPR